MALVRGQKLRFRFDSTHPLNFNLHYHAGNKVRYAVRRNGALGVEEEFQAPDSRVYCFMWRNPNDDAAVLNFTLHVDAPDPTEVPAQKKP